MLMVTKKRAEKKKPSVWKIVAIVVVVILALIALSSVIIVNQCASPCRYDKTDITGNTACPDVCETETLLERIIRVRLFK